MQKTDTNSEYDQNINVKLGEISKSLNAISSSLESLSELGYIWLQPVLLATLSNIFKSPAQIKAYLLSDGTRSTRDIGKYLNVSHQTIKNWWDYWNAEYKIVEQDSKSGSFRKLYSLSDLVAVFGIPPQKENQNE